jgi:hypothetical protein
MWDTLAENIAAQSASRAWRMPWRGVSALLLVGTGVMLAVQGLKPTAAVKSVVEPPRVAEAVPGPAAVAVELQTSPAVPAVSSVSDQRPPPAARPKAKASEKGQKPALVAQPTAADEVGLLVRARRLLHAQPERALSLTDQHSAAHPRGVFAEEREVLAIEALRQLGRHEQANQRIAKFLAAFPSSAHRRRVEALRGRE